jgi:hypothetical protein
MKTKAQIVEEHATAYTNEFFQVQTPDEGIDSEWTGMGFAELPREEQALFCGWREFHDLIVSEAIQPCE